MSGEIHSDRAPEPVGPYPHARRVGDFLYLSGVGPRSGVDGEIPGNTLNEQGDVLSYDFEAQCHAVMKNVGTILRASGAEFSNLVDVTVFLTNMADDFQTMNAIYEQYLGDPKPCRTTVEVTRLPTQIAIELKCIASLHLQEPA